MSVSAPVIDHIDPTVSPRLIYLKAGVTEYHPVDDIYKEVRNLRRTDETLRGYDLFVTAGGNVKKLADGSKRTPRYAIFINSKVVPQDVDHDLTITGEQLFSPGLGQEPIGTGAAAIDKTPLSPGVDVNVDYAPAEAEVIVVGAQGDAETTGTCIDHLSVRLHEESLTALLEGDILFTVTDSTERAKISVENLIAQTGESLTMEIC